MRGFTLVTGLLLKEHIAMNRQSVENGVGLDWVQGRVYIDIDGVRD